MFDRQILKEVRDHLDENGELYRSLAKGVVEAAEATQKRLGHDIIYRIYSRADKQGTALKSPLKIAEKLARKRRQKPTDDIDVAHVNDIVGVTVVVPFAEYRSKVIDELSRELSARSIKVGGPEDHASNGYYATHVDLVSQAPEHAGLMCELQIKTILHDAWATKTHDLTYKPNGQMDSHHLEMMKLLGDGLETFEQQSGRLRAMITSQWEIEKAIRVAARRRLFESIPVVRDLDALDAGVAELVREINRHSATLAKADSEDETVRKLSGKVTAECGRSSDCGWIAAYHFAILRPNSDNIVFATRQVRAFIKRCRRMLEKRKAPPLVPILGPIALYSLGSLDAAIDASFELLDFGKLLEARQIGDISYNLANYLIEREYFVPSREKTAQEREAAKTERLQIIQDMLATAVESGSADDAEIEQSTRGFLDIVFSESSDDIRKAIDICAQAPLKAHPSEAEIAKDFAEFYVRLGWRKLFRLQQLGP